MPHGGPYVSEVVIYDEWGQMLANNGYLVLQPQYRGSQNYGMGHWMSAFNDGSQAGRKMQDDKDDGALYLVEQGLADPNRLAIAGASYGGYAALVAASRTPQIYQCVIGIAVVSDTVMQVNFARRSLRGSSIESWLDLWLDAVSPIDEVEKVNIPILIVHGTVDQRTPPVNARKYVRALERHGKDFKYVPLEDADHFSNTFKYHHWITLYENMIDYLRHDCGPGGL
jgi:dipeptidyl aminopeptidase/acylaminoacyl peptidase